MHVLTQVTLQRLIQVGLKKLKEDVSLLDEIFRGYKFPEMEADYGESYVEGIKTWFANTKIPVVQAWSFNPERIPLISIHLSTEQEDESKAAFGDYFGPGTESEIGVGVFTVMLDIGIHTSKNGDEVLWLYYIVSYILFKNKMLADHLGLRLQTFSASDYTKNNALMADNIWTRWIKFRCTVENMWDGDPFLCIDDLEVSVDHESSVVSVEVDN